MTQARRYLDLNLELRDYNPALEVMRVSVLPSAGIGETQEAVTVPLRIGELQEDLGNLERKRIRIHDLINLGERLAGLLLPPGEVRELFRKGLTKAGQQEGLRLRVRIRHPRLAQLPWEYAYIPAAGGERAPADFLVLDPRLSLVRHLDPGGELPPLAPPDAGRLRLLAALADVSGYPKLGLQEEKAAIENALWEFNVDGVKLDWQPVLEYLTAGELAVSLAKGAHIFHFAGHGRFDPDETDPERGEMTGAGSIVLVKDGARETRQPALLDAAQLALLLSGAGVRLAVLGACQTGRLDGVSAWSGVAPALARRGVPAVAAMQYEVADEAATAFSALFYTALAAGLSVDEAVWMGRMGMRKTIGERGVEWGVPVLYLSSADGVLFPRTEGSASKTASQIRLAITQAVDTVEKGGRLVGIEADLAQGTFSVNATVEQRSATVKGEMIGARIGFDEQSSKSKGGSDDED